MGMIFSNSPCASLECCAKESMVIETSGNYQNVYADHRAMQQMEISSSYYTAEGSPNARTYHPNDSPYPLGSDGASIYRSSTYHSLHAHDLSIDKYSHLEQSP